MTECFLLFYGVSSFDFTINRVEIAGKFLGSVDISSIEFTR